MEFLCCVPDDDDADDDDDGDDADDDLGIVVEDDFKLVGASCVVEECRCKGLALFSKRLDRHQSEYKAICLVLKEIRKMWKWKKEGCAEKAKNVLGLEEQRKDASPFPYILGIYNYILGIYKKSKYRLTSVAETIGVGTRIGSRIW